MPAHFPPYDVYRELYHRNYHGRCIDEHLELGGPLTGLSVLDLCGGDGCLSLAALAQKPSRVVLVDEQEAMIPPEVESNPKIDVHISSAEVYLCGTKAATFDRIFCRQAMNYWCNERSAAQLAHVLTFDGLLVFNTFNEQPPVVPYANSYQIDGKQYHELSWLVGNDVHHVQTREGLPAHYSWCKWIPPEQFAAWLSPYFYIDVQVRGKASLYRCMKK